MVGAHKTPARTAQRERTGVAVSRLELDNYAGISTANSRYAGEEGVVEPCERLAVCFQQFSQSHYILDLAVKVYTIVFQNAAEVLGQNVPTRRKLGRVLPIVQLHNDALERAVGGISLCLRKLAVELETGRSGVHLCVGTPVIQEGRIPVDEQAAIVFLGGRHPGPNTPIARVKHRLQTIVAILKRIHRCFHVV